MKKIFITANDLLHDSYRLGAQIIESGFCPDFIVGIWRGGTPVGIVVQELLEYAGISTDHIAIRTSYYEGIQRTRESVLVHGLGYLVRKVNSGDKLLIVDDVFDSGMSIEAVINELKSRSRLNTPFDIRVATCWYKPDNNKSSRVPDYFIHKTDQWLVFPHELQGLTPEEVQKGKPEIADIVSKIIKTNI